MHFASFVPENIWHLQLTATASERFNLTVTPLKRNYLAQPDVAVISAWKKKKDSDLEAVAQFLFIRWNQCALDQKGPGAQLCYMNNTVKSAN